MSTWQPRPVAPGPCGGAPLLAVNFLPVTYTADKFPAGPGRCSPTRAGRMPLPGVPGAR